MSLRLAMGAVADQAAFALASVAVHVLLARWLPAVDYGAFAGAATLPLLAGVGHAALFIEPLLVLGAAREATAFRTYLRTVLRLQWIYGVVVAVLLAGVAAGLWLAGASRMALALVGAACATPPTLTCWFVRRACYAVERPELAAAAGFLHLTLVVVGLAGLAGTGTVSVVTAPLVTGAAAWLASQTAQWAITRPMGTASAPVAAVEIPDRWAIWRTHIAFGRWSAAAGVLSWAQGYLFYLVLPLWAGLEGTAALRALVTVVMPLLQADSALVTALVPAYVRAAGAGRLDRLVQQSLGLFALEAALYWLVLATGHAAIVAWLYAGRFVDVSPLLLVLGLLPACASAFNVWASALRARGDARAVLQGTVAAVVVACTVGLLAMRAWGLHGAVAGLLLSAATQAGVTGLAYRRSAMRVAVPHVLPVREVAC